MNPSKSSRFLTGDRALSGIPLPVTAFPGPSGAGGFGRERVSVGFRGQYRRADPMKTR